MVEGYTCLMDLFCGPREMKGQSLGEALGEICDGSNRDLDEESLPRKRYKTLGEIYGGPVKKDDEEEKSSSHEAEGRPRRILLSDGRVQVGNTIYSEGTIPPYSGGKTSKQLQDEARKKAEEKEAWRKIPPHDTLPTYPEKGLDWLLKNPILPKKNLNIPTPQIGTFGTFARSEIDRKEGPPKDFGEHLRRESKVMDMMRMKERLEKRGSFGYYHFTASDGGHKVVSMDIPYL